MPILNSEDEDSEEYESGSSDEYSEDEEDVGRIMKPVFVPRSSRVTIHEVEKKQKEEQILAEKKRLKKEERKSETRALLAESIRRNQELEENHMDDANSDAGMPDDTDGVDDELEVRKGDSQAGIQHSHIHFVISWWKCTRQLHVSVAYRPSHNILSVPTITVHLIYFTSPLISFLSCILFIDFFSSYHSYDFCCTMESNGTPTHPSNGTPTHPSNGTPTHPSNGTPTHPERGVESS